MRPTPDKWLRLLRAVLPRGSGVRWLLALALAALLVLRLQKQLPESGTPGPRDEPPTASERWERLDNCRLVESSGNDGDSFRVAAAGREVVLRLYFADCPEKHRNQFNAERLRDQGRYFGGLDEEATLAVGKAARAFALDRLRAAPFTVYTRWEPVFDSERRYAHVSVAGATGGTEDLATALVREGLARIHTTGAPHPAGMSERQFRATLKEAEKTARSQQRGAWATAAPATLNPPGIPARRTPK